MDMKETIIRTAEWVMEQSQKLSETDLKDKADKAILILADKETRDKTISKVSGLAYEKASEVGKTAIQIGKSAAEFTKNAAEAAEDLAETGKTTVKDLYEKTVEYAEDKHVLPGAKDAYILELEEELMEKDREIAQLKKIIRNSGWRKR